MAAVFRDVSVFPSYGKGAAVVSWRVDTPWRDAAFYVYRKDDGGQRWVLLNDEPVYGTMFTDTGFRSKDATNVPWYRVVAILEPGKHEADSEPVALYGGMTGRRTFGMAFKTLRLKYIQARHDGVPMLYYPALKSGKVSPYIDPLTGQRTGRACGEADTDDGEAIEDDYGTYYAGGYCPPFLTFVRLMGARSVRSNVLEDGTFREEEQVADFLPYPPVRTGDLLVDPASDRRWLVGKSIKPQMVKGVVPVGYKATITLLDTNHDAYRVPVPSNYNKMLARVRQPGTLV